ANLALGPNQARGTRAPLALAGALVLALGALGGVAQAQDPARPAGAQEGQDGPPAPVPTLERIWVPQRAFTQVLARHPSGVLLEASRLDDLLARARAEAAAGRVPVREEGPHVAALEQLT